MMIIDLVNTTTRKIEDALTSVRRRMGGPTAGKALTLVIVTDEAGHYDAIRASADASREHPSRIIAVIPRDDSEETHLDAEVRVGEGPGETVLMRLYGVLVRHAESAVLPLLVADAPVFTWWPGAAPSPPSAQPLGRLARRRITDAAATEDPLHTLELLAESYEPGDTDMSWTRVTPWRSLLAGALDQPHDPVTHAMVEASPGNPSGVLLGGWLAGRLGVPCELSSSCGPGITKVRLVTASGSIAMARPDGRQVTLTRPGRPERRVALLRRPYAELLAEELRCLNQDDVYRDAVQGWSRTVIVRAATSVS